VTTENIVVPLGRQSSDLKALYHAFALAERVSARIIVLFFKKEMPGQNPATPLEEACRQMVRGACEEGLSVSFHIVHEQFEAELLKTINIEHIDLIILSAGDTEMEATLKELKSKACLQLIKVKEKNAINLYQRR
jgi:hypothetical protein